MKIMHEALLLVASMLIASSTFCANGSKPQEIKRQMTFFQQYTLGLGIGIFLHSAGLSFDSSLAKATGVVAFGIAEGARKYAERNKNEKKYWRKVGGEVVGVLAASYACACGIDMAMRSPVMRSMVTKCDQGIASMLTVFPQSGTVLDWNKSYHLGVVGASIGGIAAVDFAGKKIGEHNKPGFWLDGIVGQTFDEHFLD